MAAITVLLVDDRRSIADLTATYLERVGDSMAVHVEESARAGLERLSDEPLDCVVSDYEMPDADGLDFLAEVRELEPDLPFILFTGKGSEEIASEAISAGVTDYLQKGNGNEQYEVLANRIENAVAQSRAEREAREANERLRRMHRRITDAFYALDDDWTITYVNEQAAAFFDRNPDELIGQDLGEAFPADVGDAFYDAYVEALEAQEPVTLTSESVFRPGRWVEERIFPSEDGLSIFFRDITEQRRREQTLDALHGATRELMHAETELEIAELVCRVADEVLDFPGTGVRLYDPERDALVNVAIGGEKADDVEDRPTFDIEETPHGRAYREGETVTFEVGEDCPYDLEPFTRTMYVPLGEYGVLSIGKQDDESFSETSIRFAEILTENARAALDRADRERRLRERERALERQNERLEAFAGVVSHDLRNPLNVARGHLEIARETGREESFDRVAAAHDRMGTLIDDLLALARDGQMVGESTPVELGAVAEDAWECVATDDAELRIRDPGTVEADSDRLRSLFENLFRNAVEHAGEAVTVSVVETDEGFAVADDGPGIPESERDRIFEDGYSDSEDGIGLGLTIVEGVAEAHGWDVRVGESETGGARFVVVVE